MNDHYNLFHVAPRDTRAQWSDPQNAFPWDLSKSSGKKRAPLSNNFRKHDISLLETQSCLRTFMDLRNAKVEKIHGPLFKAVSQRCWTTESFLGETAMRTSRSCRVCRVYFGNAALFCGLALIPPKQAVTFSSAVSESFSPARSV